jgi:hypothetical protein
VIADEILVGGRHERGEAAQEGHGFEGEVGPRGVRFWPGPVQLIEDVAVGGDGDPVQRNLARLENLRSQAPCGNCDSGDWGRS